MTTLVVELDEGAVGAGGGHRRAGPLDFIGSFASDAVAARDTDAHLVPSLRARRAAKGARRLRRLVEQCPHGRDDTDTAKGG